MERMTDKGLVIGLFVDEPPKAPDVKEERIVSAEESVATESVATEHDEAEAPTVTAEIVPASEAPRRRGRPRKINN